jgi:trinucleotide repeat-containing gene 6 protein
MQHGPLQNFHLYLNHGVALCKYSTREETNKAQQALNNCVLSNTTICAEIISDNEVQSFLQRFGTPGNAGATGSSGGNTWRPSNPPPTRSSGSFLWIAFLLL